MAKMKTLLVLLVITLAGLTVGVFLGMTPSNNRKPKSMKPPTLNDLSEYGIYIVDQSDSSFDSRLLASFGNESAQLNDLDKRFSIFVVNNSGRNIVAVAVHWEFAQEDGQKISKYKAFRQFNLFDNNISYSLGLASGVVPPQQPQPVIEPHAARFFSLTDTTGIGKASIGSGGGVFRANSRSSPVQERADGPNATQARIEQYAELQASDLVGLLEKSVSWSISVDGVFFEDGTFVGPDKKGFFETVKAEQDAISDLLMEIEKGVAKPKGEQAAAYREIFNYLKSLVGPGAPGYSMATPPDPYKRSKTFCARQILGSWEKVGDEKIMNLLREELKKPRVRLMKQEGSAR